MVGLCRSRADCLATALELRLSGWRLPPAASAGQEGARTEISAAQQPEAGQHRMNDVSGKKSVCAADQARKTEYYYYTTRAAW